LIQNNTVIPKKKMRFVISEYDWRLIKKPILSQFIVDADKGNILWVSCIFIPSIGLFLMFQVYNGCII